MPEDRTVTIPADAMQRVADQLCDFDWNLPQDEAMDRARDIVIDVTEAVDKLRAGEGEMRPSFPATVPLSGGRMVTDRKQVERVVVEGMVELIVVHDLDPDDLNALVLSAMKQAD